ncbi:hypothetical protein GCM10009555_077670 [Acrocarpospora macrocephala]|uniref:Uncharacterized protein n=1 Tax=Acrocarpospora macrocephala TaxID=150177 RepID=A0A5M3X725_9ACTN|nr:hypothetical protein [Acrocarpospora macrocephala]GES15959.1 hypothetical protein Amac_095570 [Acrocarpospora macrocephala]
MSLEFLGKDPDSPNGGSPTIWQDTETGDLWIQGWTVQGLAARAEIGTIPDGEAVVRVPRRMLQFFPEGEQ